jgi:hypothetical protein
MTGSQYRVLTTLLDYSDATGRNAFPSVETMAADCDMTDRNIKRCLSWLRDSGWIVQRSRGGRGKGGAGWASVYDLPMPEAVDHGDIHGQSWGHSGSVMGTSTVSHGDTSVTPSDPLPSPGSNPLTDPGPVSPTPEPSSVGENEKRCQDMECNEGVYHHTGRWCLAHLMTSQPELVAAGPDWPPLRDVPTIGPSWE